MTPRRLNCRSTQLDSQWPKDRLPEENLPSRGQKLISFALKLTLNCPNSTPRGQKNNTINFLSPKSTPTGQNLTPRGLNFTPRSLIKTNRAHDLTSRSLKFDYHNQNLSSTGQKSTRIGRKLALNGAKSTSTHVKKWTHLLPETKS